MNINRISSVLIDYLDRPTNYAILLTGEWGVGKTYYIKNSFFPIASDISTVNSGAKKKYKPILISLFGVKSIDDIKDRIWIALYPLINNRYLRLSGPILSSIVKSADITKLIGKGIAASAAREIEKGTEKVKKQLKNNLNFDNLLLCFDDLERVSQKYLEENEILGFINSLVEHDNNKVIIIANETKLDPNTFKKIKEKTIGHTLHFEQDFSDALSNILASKNYPDAYIAYLKQHEQEIERALQNIEGSINYRTLLYFISYFSTIYDHLKLKQIPVSALEEKIDFILYDLMLFSLGITEEYKKGEISYKANKGLNNQHALVAAMLWNKNERPESYTTKFLEKYYTPEHHYWYYETVYDFITGGEAFSIEKLILELKNRYNIKGDGIPEPYKVYNQLMAHDYLLIDDSENKELLKKLKEYALGGAFLPAEYPNIFYALVRDSNVLGLKPTKLANQFIDVIKRIKNKHIHHPLMHQYLTYDESNPFFEEFNHMRDVLLEINKMAKVNHTAQNSKELKQLLKQDFNAFYQRLLDSESDTKIYMSFNGLSSVLLSNVFTNLTNNQKQNFIYMIFGRYVDKYNSDLVDDLPLLESLKEKIDSKISKRKLKNNSGMLYRSLQSTLVKAIESVQSIQAYPNSYASPS